VLVGFIDDQFSLPAWLLLDSYSTFVNNQRHPQPPLVLLSTHYCRCTHGTVVGITNAINLMDGMDGLAGRSTLSPP